MDIANQLVKWKVLRNSNNKRLGSVTMSREDAELINKVTNDIHLEEIHDIGRELRKRMDLLEIDTSTLAEMTFIEEKVIEDILNNKIAYEEIDEFDLSAICTILHCDTRYFVDEEVRWQDHMARKQEYESHFVPLTF